MKGKVILITGATNGIGLEAARALGRSGARLVIVGRSADKTNATADLIRRDTGADVTPLIADLSQQADIRALAADFKTRFDRLDVLINNAGAYFNSKQMTADGFEMTFALNHLSYFLLTHLLLDVIKDSAPARIINVSSNAHKFGGIDFDNLQAEKRFGGMIAYGQSKLENILFTYELARRLEGTGVTVNALHPGVVRTGFGKNNGALMTVAMNIFQGITGISAEQGADTIVYLASSPEVADVSGKYFYKRRAIKSSAVSYDTDAAARLWAISEALTGINQTVKV
ncbi:MAG TPA: SDR family oxidoreductase [Aggregatilineales bacterium]|nr:SDR family oxidoreductase [Aggregatilineales bacterium]